MCTLPKREHPVPRGLAFVYDGHFYVMIYNININQKAVIDNGWGLEINHMVVLQAIGNILEIPSGKKVTYESEEYGWVSYTKIISEMPLLKIKKRRLFDLIKELESCGLIKVYPYNKERQMTFFRKGESYHKLIFSDLKEQPMQKIAEAYAENCIGGMQKIAEYYNTNTILPNNLSLVAEEKEILNHSINSNPRSGKANAVIDSSAKSYTKELDSRYISFAKIYNFKETNLIMQGLWNKLTEEEKDRVVTHVVKYFEYQPDKSYIVDAKKYLIEKKFDFDVIDKRPKPPKKDLISV